MKPEDDGKQLITCTLDDRLPPARKGRTAAEAMVDSIECATWTGEKAQIPGGFTPGGGIEAPPTARVIEDSKEIYLKAKGKKGGKSVLVKDVMATGVTARKATQAVNAVLDRITHAVWTGEEVEIPGGVIQAEIRKGKPRQEFHRFRSVQTGEVRRKLIKYPGRHRVVKFRPDQSLDLTPPPVPPPPPPPETPERTEGRQLATELLGLSRPADNALLARLQQAVEVHPHKPGSLLRRLREFRDRGWQFLSVDSLAAQVTAHHWL